SIFNGNSWTVNQPFINGEFGYFYEIFADYDGVIWLASTKGILKQGPNSTWIQYTEAGDNIYSLNQDDYGRLWAGSYGNITIKNGGEWGTYYNLGGVVPYAPVRIFRDSKGYMWIAHGNGVTKGDPELATAVSDPEQQKNVVTIYPNPFSAVTTVQFELEKTAEVALEFCDMKGSMIFQSPAQQFSTGKNSISLDGSKWPAGLYFGTVKVDGKRTGILKMIKSN
ncbi:MAG TPA: two-component regulator propeller domain-containing protein, partial [Chitinophagales bacterium]|nr:two-component regulator propeller domain-containing protein [Chitinophagales bacterium]